MTPSEKKNLVFLPHCPDWLSELEKLNEPRCRTTEHLWSSGAWCYPKWEGLSQNSKVWIMPNVFIHYISTLRGGKEKKQQRKPQTSTNHQQKLIFNSSYEHLSLILQLLHVSKADIQISSSLVLLGYPYATRDFIDFKGHYPAVSAVFQAVSFISIGLFRERIIACCLQGVTEHSSLSVMVCH